MAEHARVRSSAPERSAADETSPGRALVEAVRFACAASDGPRLTSEAAERLERAIINAAALSRVTVHAARQAGINEFFHPVGQLFPLLGTNGDERAGNCCVAWITSRDTAPGAALVAATVEELIRRLVSCHRLKSNFELVQTARDPLRPSSPGLRCGGENR